MKPRGEAFSDWPTQADMRMQLHHLKVSDEFGMRCAERLVPDIEGLLRFVVAHWTDNRSVRRLIE
jgi:hypothetical protein